MASFCSKTLQNSHEKEVKENERLKIAIEELIPKIVPRQNL